MPRTKTVTTELFYFNELSDKAQERAREWFRNGLSRTDWYQSIYDDAKTVGLTITAFELDRCRHVTGKLTCAVRESVNAIIDGHGKDTVTYKMVRGYKNIVGRERMDDVQDHLADGYRDVLCEAYAIILQDKYDYITSDAHVEAELTLNKYEFLENGQRA